MGQEPMPPQGGSPGASAPAPGGGDAVSAMQQVDAALQKIAKGTAQAQGVPDQAKAAFQQAAEAFRAGLEALSGGESAEEGSGPVSPEQGGSRGAVPVNPGRPA